MQQIGNHVARGLSTHDSFVGGGAELSILMRHFFDYLARASLFFSSYYFDLNRFLFLKKNSHSKFGGKYH